MLFSKDLRSLLHQAAFEQRPEWWKDCSTGRFRGRTFSYKLYRGWSVPDMFEDQKWGWSTVSRGESGRCISIVQGTGSVEDAN